VVDLATGLRLLGASDAPVSVRATHADRFVAAEIVAARAPVRMGGPGHLDLIYNAAEAVSAVRVVETGVAYGWSSLALLLSLAHRPGALLVSTDLPHVKREGSEAHVGAVVPTDLRGAWKVISRADREALPEAIRLAAPIDLCHYDSDKSYAGRAWAYPLLWGALRSGGLFLSDDIGDNLGFCHFCDRVGVEPVVFESTAARGKKYVGALRKPILD
jgi:predicted O-methyltransferase YrrM